MSLTRTTTRATVHVSRTINDTLLEAAGIPTVTVECEEPAFVKTWSFNQDPMLAQEAWIAKHGEPLPNGCMLRGAQLSALFAAFPIDVPADIELADGRPVAFQLIFPHIERWLLEHPEELPDGDATGAA